MEFLHEFFDNVRHNLFKPLLLFFYMGFSVPFLGVPFEFPHALYQTLVIYLLMSIGWHGGEELASLTSAELSQAGGFMALGFLTNTLIGIIAYVVLSNFTKLRRIDAATVAGYYGSDSAGTFLTCVGVLGALQMKYAAYMPVMLAVMEIPGCLVALTIVSRLRSRGMDINGNLPGEPGYDAANLAENGNGNGNGHGNGNGNGNGNGGEATHGFNKELLKEVFLNPGLFLLFGGILIGFISQVQGKAVTAADDKLFVDLFPAVLCLFLLEMGMTAARRLQDLKTAGVSFIMFGILAPNLFATFGMCVQLLYSHVFGINFDVGTYVLFAVLCGAASYIAVPAIQRLAIPEASPTLPLAASLGLTFSYNVTIGIPVYIAVAKLLLWLWPLSVPIATLANSPS